MTTAIIETLRLEAIALKGERNAYMQAKGAKAKAEDELLKEIVQAAMPALEAVSSNLGYGVRGIAITDRLALGVNGVFFFKAEALDYSDALDRTTPAVILAVILTAIRAQTGKLKPRLEEIKRETAILEGIAMAFKVGGVRDD